MPVYLAHGALGPWDEVIFIGVAVVFVIMMGVSWVRSRSEEAETPDDLPTQSAQTTNDGEHFQLD